MSVAKRMAAVLAVMAVVVGGSQVSAQAAPQTWDVFNYHSGDCLYPQGSVTLKRTQVEQQTCVASRVIQQLWVFEPSSDGYYRIRNYGNVVEDVCLNVKGASDANSAKIELWTCGDAPQGNDQWLPDLVARKDGLDYYLLRSRDNNNKCLNVQGGSQADGADIIQFSCDRNAQNEWFSWVEH